MRRRAAAVVCVALVGATACSGSSDKSSDSTTTTTRVAATRPTTPRPPGPAADMSHELTGGQGVYIGEATPANVKQYGFVEHEYLAAGTATSYKPAGTLTRDGRWQFVPDATAPYRTRVLVRRPADAKTFSGNVIVEWLNVSGGVDADPGWVMLRDEMVRRGDAWVGVTTQRLGIEPGPILVPVDIPGSENAGKGLKMIDPARYGSLDHPGDGFSYDMFTQAARAIRAGAGMGGLQPQRVIALGQSQSAVALTTYFNGVEPLAHAFDGYFVHSRFAVALPLVEPGHNADLLGAILGNQQAILRTDQAVPVIDIQTETDVGVNFINSYAVRQPDSKYFRLWEVAGTGHADTYLAGADANAGFKCALPINDGPMHVVAKAALHALTTWLATGQAPVVAPRLEVMPGTTPKIRRTADGIALGGIRTPPVDVPVATLSGEPGPKPTAICLLVGSTKPFSAARLAQLYPSRAAYIERYNADADAAIKAGFVLREDHDALLAYAEPERISAG